MSCKNSQVPTLGKHYCGSYVVHLHGHRCLFIWVHCCIYRKCRGNVPDPFSKMLPLGTELHGPATPCCFAHLKMCYYFRCFRASLGINSSHMPLLKSSMLCQQVREHVPFTCIHAPTIVNLAYVINIVKSLQNKSENISIENRLRYTCHVRNM